MTLPSFEDHHGDPELVKEGWFDTLARTVAVDFDGVLHPYTNGWCGSVPAHEPPTMGADAFLNQLVIEQGYRVVVFSTRANHQEGHDGIVAWLLEYDLMQYVDEITHEKPPAIAYIDDRAIPFRGSWTDVLSHLHVMTMGDSRGAHTDTPVDLQQ